MTNYLILGAGGAIGAYFLTRLRTEGNTVSSLSSGKGSNWVYDVDSIRAEIVALKPRVIISLAGSFVQDYATAYKVNVLIAKNLFDAAIAAEFDGKVILTGSAAEYGIQDRYVEPRIGKPLSIYGLTKQMQHRVFEYYVSTSGLKANYVRLSNVVDLSLSDELFIGNFTKQVRRALKGDVQEIRLGDLNSERDLIWIDDVYTGFRKVIDAGLPGETYNVGTGAGVCLREFVQAVLSSLDLRVTLRLEDAKSVGNMRQRVVSEIAKIRSLGWSPQFDSQSLVAEYCRRLRKENMSEREKPVPHPQMS
jgi:GDP-4-dehydro-6-deoxy-D-mannose reductase